MTKIPEVKDLSEIYDSNLNFQKERFSNIKIKFKEIFGVFPSFISRYLKIKFNFLELQEESI